MSKRVYFDGEPRIEYSACTPPLKLPRFALWNPGRTLTPAAAMVDAVARRNRKRVSGRGWSDHGQAVNEASEQRAVFTDRRPALKGSDMFHVPRATMYFKVKVGSNVPPEP